jgi:hypothetical protein
MLNHGNNPAGRVYSILRQAKDTGGLPTIAAGLAKLFGVTADANGDIFRNLGLLDAELDEITLRLQAVGETRQYDIYKKTLPRLKKILSFQNLGTPWDSFRASYIFEEDLKTLEFCSALLDGRFPEEAVTVDELATLLKQVNALWDEVLASSLDADLKVQVLDCLEQIRRAIRDYKITGIAPLRRAAFEAVAVVVTAAPKTSTDAWTKFATIVNVVTTLTKFGSAIAPHLPQIHEKLKLLEHLK